MTRGLRSLLPRQSAYFWAGPSLRYLTVQSLFDKALINATSESDFKQRLNVAAGVWVGIVGLIFGLSYLTFDRAVSGAWEEVGRRAVRAAVPLAVVSFISGYLAQWIYYEMASSATSVSTAYVARMIGWAIFGGGIGLAIGLVDKSKQRAINGALGGLAGGAIGGVVFEFVLRKEIFGESLGSPGSSLGSGARYCLCGEAGRDRSPGGLAQHRCRRHERQGIHHLPRTYPHRRVTRLRDIPPQGPGGRQVSRHYSGPRRSSNTDGCRTGFHQSGASSGEDTSQW